MRQLPVNEHFFDRESKAMWYLVGVSYSRYYPSRTDNTNTWSSSSRRLIEIVQELLEAEHDIYGPDAAGTYQLRFRSTPIHEKLLELGCVPGRENRKFPEDLGPNYLAHLDRGFLDASAIVTGHTDENSRWIRIHYENEHFLREFNRHLVRLGVVRKGRVVRRNSLNYWRRDELDEIHDFIYSDWKFIEKHGLYLPEKKDRFQRDRLRIRPEESLERRVS